MLYFHDKILIPVGKQIAESISVSKQNRNEIKGYEDRLSAAKQGLEFVDIVTQLEDTNNYKKTKKIKKYVLYCT